ncbi:hypothetical protein Pfo_009209 [Paulownia fortunei]|nr:hypothetical protein Pfo_009209 [Paulownia fortunei]
MFYSQLLLSKKGALGIIWMAAHCHKRLKKDQVQQTDISSSVDKILDDEVPVVTHRILAFLLLGVVRIYSKKVEYLFHDCHEILNKLCGFRIAKSTRAGIGVSRTQYHSITLPKRFELDAFDLELLEDQDLVGGNGRSHEQDTLADGCRKEGSTSGLLYKENMPFSEAYSTAYTPPRDVFSSHQMDQDLFVSPSSNMNISLSGLEVLRGTSFALEDRLDPIVLDEAEEEQMQNKPSNEDLRTNFQGPTNNMESDSVESLSTDRRPSVPSLEILRGTGFSLEDRLDPMVLDEAEKEQLNDRPFDDNIRSNFWGPIQDVEFDSVANPSPQGSDSVASLGILHKSGFSLEHSPNFNMLNEAEKGQGHNVPSDKEHGVEEEHVEHLRTQLNFQEDEPHDFTGSVDKAQPVGAKKMKFLEVITPESVKCQRLEEFPMSIVTPDSKLPAGVGTPEVATVQTPATKERAKILKKRKTLFDLTTVVPHKVFKSWIEDLSDLKRERRKVPHTLLHAWRARKLGHVPQSFFEPLIPGISIDLGYLECKKSCAAAIKSVELSVRQDDVQSPVTHGIREQILDIRSPVTQSSPEQTPIAPGTPVTHLNSLRSHEAGAVADSDILEPTTSLESIEKWPSASEALELGVVFREVLNFSLSRSACCDPHLVHN